MKEIIKIELERAFKGISMKVALLIGIVISIANLIQQVYPKAADPLQNFSTDAHILPFIVFNSWMGGNMNFQYTLFIRLIPLLVVLPYGISYFTDRKDGIIKNYYTRLHKKKYLIAKYITVFLSSGIVVTLPLLFNLFVTSAVLPSIIPEATGQFAICANSMWSSLFYTHPYIYILMYIVVIFVVGGLYGCMALAVSQFANNRFVILAFPFLLCSCLNMITSNASNYIIRGLTPSRIFDMTQIGACYGISIIIEIITLLIIGFGLFYWKGVHDDTF